MLPCYAPCLKRIMIWLISSLLVSLKGTNYRFTPFGLAGQVCVEGFAESLYVLLYS